MNIKKAFTKLAYISAGRDCDSYMSLNEMRMILEALDEPPESIGEISSRFYNENRQLKIDLDLANADIETFNKEIERLKEVITALQKIPSGLHMFQKLQDERDKLYGEISIANGLVKNLESKLRVEGYRIEVKDSLINHLKTILKVNGIEIKQ